MSTSNTTSTINGTTTRFMSLLLPGWGDRRRLAALEIQERQYRRGLLTIQDVDLFQRRENLAHGLQIEAAARHLRRLAVFRQQRRKPRCVALGGVDGGGGRDLIPGPR